MGVYVCPMHQVRGWTGVLVEPDPAYFLQILGKNRRAWSVNAALSPSRRPSLVSQNLQWGPWWSQ